jgi:hypothetical protein
MKERLCHKLKLGVLDESGIPIGGAHDWSQTGKEISFRFPPCIMIVNQFY